MKDEEMTIIEKTTMYMENYSELVRYITEAVSESSQTDPRYNISAEKHTCKVSVSAVQNQLYYLNI